MDRPGGQQSPMVPPPAVPVPTPLPVDKHEEPFLTKAKELEKAGEWAKAVTAYKAAISGGTDTVDIHFRLAQARIKAGWLRSAHESLSEVLRREPANALARERIGQVEARIKATFRTKDVHPSVACKPRQEKADAADRSRQKQLAELRKLRRDMALMRCFVAQIAAGPDPLYALGGAVDVLHAVYPTLAGSIAFQLSEMDGARDLGCAAMARLHGQRRLDHFVLDLVQDLPEADQEALLPLSLRAAIKFDSKDARARILNRLRKGPHTALDEESAETLLLAAASLRDDDLVRAALRAIDEMPSSQPGPATSKLGLAQRRAEVWLADRAERTHVPGPAFGVLSYRSPTKPSTNVGDYVQTIAALGLLATTAPCWVGAEGSAAAALARTRAAVHHQAGRDAGASAARSSEAPAAAAGPSRRMDVVFVDRDDPSTCPTGGPIWLIVNGWFMHEDFDDRFKFPFADNVRPLFLAMHIARPEMLTEEAVVYLRRFEPIGARDAFTRDLLEAHGIKSFLNGCPTLTLDLVFGRRRERRSGRFHASHSVRKQDNVAEDAEIRLHTDPDVPVRDRTACVDQAWSFLEDYAGAAHVVTPLLHCYLPCCALGTPVEFVHPKKDTDPRFGGIVGLAERKRVALRQAMVARLRSVVEAITAGASEAEIWARWRATAPDKPNPAPALQRQVAVTETLDRVETLAQRLAKRVPEQVAFGSGADVKDAVDVVMAFDRNLAREARVTMRSALDAATRPLRFHVLTRGVGKDFIHAASDDLETELVWSDMSAVEYGDLKLLSHTTVSTMDRLLIPEILSGERRCVYLDVDVAVLGDLAELVVVPLDGKPFAARRTLFKDWNSGFAIARIIERSMKPKEVARFRADFVTRIPMGFPTFNAGVQVIDLAAARRERFAAACIDVVTRHGVNDQFAMNLVARGAFRELDPSWNHFPTQEVLQFPKIVHYIGPLKPWHRETTPKARSWRAFIRDADGIAPTWLHA